jgi:hypothetical protein
MYKSPGRVDRQASGKSQRGESRMGRDGMSQQDVSKRRVDKMIQLNDPMGGEDDPSWPSWQ